MWIVDENYWIEKQDMNEWMDNNVMECIFSDEYSSLAAFQKFAISRLYLSILLFPVKKISQSVKPDLQILWMNYF